MSNPRRSEFLEIIDDGLAERSLVVCNPGVFVLQINGFRFRELITEQITVGEVSFDQHGIFRRKFQRFEASCDRLTGFSIEELILAEIYIITSIFRIELSSLL